MPSFRPLVIGVALVALLAIPTIAIGDDGASNPSNPTDATASASALENVPGVLDASASVQATSDGDSALIASVQGGTVDVSNDPTSGISIAATDGTMISVAIPGADSASAAQPLANDAVVFTNVAPDASIVAQATPAVADAADLIPAVDASSDSNSIDTSTDQGSDQSANADATADGDADTTADVSTPSTDSSSGDAANSDAVANEGSSADTSQTAVDDDSSDAGVTSDSEPADASGLQPGDTGLSAVGGGLRLMVVISSPNAPSDYDFHLSIPDGDSIATGADGGYKVLDSQGSTVLTVLPSWARDANDNLVPSSYSLDGTTLTLHVDLTGATFPVVADPSLSTAGAMALPFSGISDSADLSGNRLVAGTVPMSGGLSGLGGVVYALAWPSTSTSDVTPELSISHQPTPVAQTTRINSDGSFVLRVPSNINLSDFSTDSGKTVTFDLYAIINGHRYYSVFSRDIDSDGSFVAPVPDVNLSFSTPAVNSAGYSSVSVANATASLGNVFSSSTTTTYCGRKPQRVKGVYVYSCDAKGHAITAPKALVNAVVAELNNLSPACAEDGCDYDFNYGSAERVWSTIGNTFISGSPTAAHRYIYARFSFANAARATLGVGVSGSAFIGGFHLGGTKGITNTVDFDWGWTKDGTALSYQRRAYYQLREHWYAAFYPDMNMVLLTNQQNSYSPVAFEQIGSRTPKPARYPIARTCQQIKSLVVPETVTRNTHAFATIIKGVNFTVSSPFNDKYGPARVGLSLTSQSGADSWVIAKYKVKDYAWICGNSTDQSVEPFDAPKIQAIHGKKLPHGAIEWWYQPVE
jgi:hypothetical protein